MVEPRVIIKSISPAIATEKYYSEDDIKMWFKEMNWLTVLLKGVFFWCVWSGESIITLIHD